MQFTREILFSAEIAKLSAYNIPHLSILLIDYQLSENIKLKNTHYH